MTIPVYCELGETCTVFDGHIARKHLEHHLAMSLHDRTATDTLTRYFETWHRDISDTINLRSGGPVLIVPKEWFA
jgi:hypothetical protein